jgi:hypothetical protein
MKQPCTLSAFLTKNVHSTKGIVGLGNKILRVGLAPYGQKVGSIFRKVFIVDESSMYNGVFPKKWAYPLKVSDWTIIYFRG